MKSIITFKNFELSWFKGLSLGLVVDTDSKRRTDYHLLFLMFAISYTYNYPVIKLTNIYKGKY